MRPAYKPKDIESHRLSNGQLAVITKTGRKYRFAQLDPNEGVVQSKNDLRLSEAMDQLADVLRADVMDEL